jgi:hypothetical protein
MNVLSHLFGRGPKGGARRRPGRLGIEALEDRTVPASVQVVPLTTDTSGTAFHTLADAIKAAGANGVVTVEPGAVADTSIDITQNGITIQGDPNVPSSILPGYNISIDANGVTLRNLNINFVSVDPGFGGMTITHSTVGSVFVSGGASGNGSNVITQNAISSDVTIIGNTNLGAGTNDQVTNNTFSSFSDTIISLTADSGAVVSGNTITGGGAITTDTGGNTVTNAPQTGIAINGGAGVRVSNNHITIAGTSGAFFGIAISPFDPNTAGLPTGTPTTPPSVQVLTNSIATGRGIGLSIKAPNTGTGDRDTQVLVQGNDFHSNIIGVNYTGNGGKSLTTDLGGGALGSLGGNNFRGFTNRGTGGSAAVVLQGVGAGAVLSARENLFQNGITPANVVFASSGSIDVSAPLTNDQAFVQTLFNDFLGRAGTVGELNFWVNVLNTDGNGRANVLNGILRSNEALSRIVDSFYLKYLGRAADSSGEQFWVAQIQGGASLESIQAGFISSPEFISSNNSDFVQGLYRTFLGRTGNSQELAYWYGQLPSLGLSGVALGFATSAENRNAFITQVFKQDYHRNPSGGEVSFWAGQSGDLLSLEIQLLGTSEFGSKG